MQLLDTFRHLLRRRATSGGPIAQQMSSRLAADERPGLLDPDDPAGAAAAAAEVALGERHARELHAWGARPPAGLGRRARALSAAAGRRKPKELAEALEGLWPWEVPALLEEFEGSGPQARGALGDTIRLLLDRAESHQVLASAISLLALNVEERDRERLLFFGRSPALTASCALALEPLGPTALLQLAAVSVGLGRSLALERLGLAMALGAELAPAELAEAFSLAALVEDPVARAYAAVPLLEAGKVPLLMESHPAAAAAVASCLEATSRGGWHGGPGPGLGRLPGALEAAEWILPRGDLPGPVREQAARAVLDAHPMPVGPIIQAAQAALVEVAGAPPSEGAGPDSES